MSKVVEAFSYVQISASSNVFPNSTGPQGPCYLGGIFVSSASSSPTITVYDSATNGTTTKVVDTFTPVAGQFYPMPFQLSAGAYVVIGGTVSCTVAVRNK